MDRPERMPPDIDIEQPSAARMYDYYLGGSHNFAADRAAAEVLIRAIPDVIPGVKANRAFLRRAVRFLTGRGITQFLDIGSGIPSVGNVHEVARAAVPGARVAYVDIDPVAVAHAEEILAGDPGTVVVREDLRAPERMLDHPDVRRVLDLGQPVGVMLVAILHFVGDAEDPAGLVARVMASLPPGSYLTISHGSSTVRPSKAKVGEDVYRNTATPLTLRDQAQVTALFGGLPLVEPGLVWAPEWHPDSAEEVGTDPGAGGILVGMAVKPG
ncbi:MAG TPA: SAM-dependent methyltransferase [Rugosimonospora sp.]|nr:SAM-dependent methyltransferase [Rugosimonospora sp.]